MRGVYQVNVYPEILNSANVAFRKFSAIRVVEAVKVLHCRLVRLSQSTAPQSLSTFLYSTLVITSTPLCRRSDRVSGLPLVCLYHCLCQSSRSHLIPKAGCGSGESSGVSTGHSAYITSTLGPFVLFDPGLLRPFKNRQQHMLWR